MTTADHSRRDWPRSHPVLDVRRRVMETSAKDWEGFADYETALAHVTPDWGLAAHTRIDLGDVGLATLRLAGEAFGEPDGPGLWATMVYEVKDPWPEMPAHKRWHQLFHPVGIVQHGARSRASTASRARCIVTDTLLDHVVALMAVTRLANPNGTAVYPSSHARHVTLHAHDLLAFSPEHAHDIRVLAAVDGLTGWPTTYAHRLAASGRTLDAGR